MLIFLIVILLLAALLEYLSLRGGTSCVDAQFSLSAKCTEPDAPVELTVTAVNASRIPITYLALKIAFPLCASLPEGAAVQRDLQLATVTDVFRLWGRQKLERSMSFSIGNRGVHTVSGRQIARGDFLGLSTQSSRFPLRRTLLVYPRSLSSSALTEALGSYCGELSARRWLIRDPVLTLGVREYTGNEPMHTISWSQTARRGELTVREFDYTRSLNCCVLLSVSGLDQNDTELLDRCCGAARTVCETLIAHGVEAALYTNAALVGYPNAPFRAASASLGREKDVLDILARATAAPCASPAALALGSLEAQTRSSAFVLIVPHEDDASGDALRALSERSDMGALCIAVDRLEVD